MHCSLHLHCHGNQWTDNGISVKLCAGLSLSSVASLNSVQQSAGSRRRGVRRVTKASWQFGSDGVRKEAHRKFRSHDAGGWSGSGSEMEPGDVRH